MYQQPHGHTHSGHELPSKFGIKTPSATHRIYTAYKDINEWRILIKKAASAAITDNDDSG